MPASPEPSARAAERGVALAGRFTGPVIAITGDDARIELHAGSEELGDVLELVRRGARVRKARLRKIPLRDVIPPFTDHLDREAEVRQVLAAAAGRPVGLVGEPGVGKTFVLAHALARAAPDHDGVVYRSALALTASDVLFTLYLARYDCDALDRPSDPAIAVRLRDWRALIVIDGLALSPSEAQALALALPGCRVIVASREPVLWDADLVPLGGLEPGDALELLARGLGRPPARDELEDARALCAAVGGHPGRIRQAAWTARTRGLRAVAAGLEAASGEQARADVIADELTSGQRGALGLVAAAGGASIAAADVPDGATLEQAGLITRSSPRYRLAGGFAPAIAEPDRTAVRALLLGRRQLDRGDVVLGAALAASADDGAAIDLARAIDAGLARERLWGLRRETLGRMRDAARRTGSAAAEGWALHQLGTLLVCLGDRRAGIATLERALELRSGDAARVTRHNLHVAGGGGGEITADRGGNGGGPRFPWLAVLLAVVALGVGVGAAVLATGGGDDTTATGSSATRTSATGTTTTTTTTTTKAPTVTIALRVDGDGGVTSDPPGIDCPQACAAGVRTGTRVTLTAQPLDGAEFKGFGPPCARASPCVLTPSADTSVTALFQRSTPETVPITVRIAGAGTVTSDPAGITCSQSCTTQVTAGTSLTLTATPADGGAFKGWSGGECSGRGTCSITADQPRTAAAAFSSPPPPPPPPPPTVG